MFECWKDVVCEIEGRVREFVQENTFHGAAQKPRDVKESERKRGGWN